MLRSFIAWLDDYLAGEGPPAIAKAVVGIMSFAALLGTLLGGVAVKAGVLVAVLLSLIGLALLLLADRRALHRKYEIHRQLVSQYYDFITQLSPAPQIINWEQVTRIDEKGNTRETTVIRAKTLCDDLQFFRLRFGPLWNQPPKYRRGVRVNVRSLSVSDVPGTSLKLTSSWLANNKLDLLVHLHSPPRRGGEIRISVDWSWPGKAIPLVRGEPDAFVFDLSKPMTYGSMRIILPVGHDAYYEPVGFVEGEEGFSIEPSVDHQGNVQFLFETHQLDANRRAGVRLELKRKGATPLQAGAYSG